MLKSEPHYAEYSGWLIGDEVEGFDDMDCK